MLPEVRTRVPIANFEVATPGYTSLRQSILARARPCRGKTALAQRSERSAENPVRARVCSPAVFRLNLGCLWILRERDDRFELVSAGLAFPQMPHALRAEILRPLRHQDCFAAL